MFFSNKELDKIDNYLDKMEKYIENETNSLETMESLKSKKYKKIQEKIENISNKLREKRVDDLKVYGEIMLSCEKLSDGFTDDKICTEAKDPKIAYLSKTINSMNEKIDISLCEVISRLQEYENLDYTNEVDEKIFRGGKLKELLIGINSLKQKITENLKKSVRESLVLKHESDTLKEESDILANSSMTQATTVEEASASIDEITSNIKESTMVSSNMSSLGEKVKITAQEGKEYASKTLSSMEDIFEATKKVNEAISVISEIAFQTNILSLNASVEAATAGEAGKSFAVVASEVGNLANKSRDAAKEIQELMDNLQTKTTEGKDTTFAMVKEYEELNSNISLTLEYIQKIEQSSRHQEKSIVQINNAVSQIDTLTQQNAEVANKVKDIAIQANNIATQAAQTAEIARFEGKDEIKIRKSNFSSYDGIERRSI